jgi:putative phosphoesterase
MLLDMTRIGLISDVHCNVEKLSAALSALADCDEVFLAGDLMYQYRFAPEILSLVQEHGVHAIVGNHDVSLEQSWTQRSLHPDVTEALRVLPRSIECHVGGLRIGVFHGSPWDRTDDGYNHYLFPSDTSQLHRAADGPYDVVLLGHTHVPMSVQVGDTLVVNAGTCGEPGRLDRRFTCASIDLGSGQVELHDLSQRA